MKYAVVIERGPTSYGATVPDLPGCVAVAHTREEVERLIQEAILAHLEGLPVPEPRTQVATIEIADAQFWDLGRPMTRRRFPPGGVEVSLHRRDGSRAGRVGYCDAYGP